MRRPWPTEWAVVPKNKKSNLDRWKIYRTSTDISDSFFLNCTSINNKYEIGEWPKDFTEVTMIALKKRPETTKCSNHCTISHITHTVKTE
jgi:hypothetical protein